LDNPIVLGYHRGLELRELPGGSVDW